MKKIFFVLVLIIISILIIVSNKEKKIKMIVAGDALINVGVLESAYDEKTDNYNFKPIINNIKNHIKNYDLAFYNQETPISGKQFAYRGYDCYNTPEQFGKDMIDAGFNMVSIANNHTFDGELGVVNGHYYCYKNEMGAINFINFWNNQKGIYVSGGYKNQKEREKNIIKEKKGIKYTLLSYTYGLNIPVGYKESPYLVNIYDKEQVKNDIERIKDKVDIIIVSMHWGYKNEENFIPNQEQKEQARYLASLGVDIIIGHHPYVIQPIEYIGDTLVFYSLGRVVSAFEKEDNNYDLLIGLLGEITITKKGKKVSVKSTNNELVYNYYDKDNKKVLSIPFADIKDKSDKKFISIYEKYSKIVTLYDPRLKVNFNNESIKKQNF